MIPSIILLTICTFIVLFIFGLAMCVVSIFLPKNPSEDDTEDDEEYRDRTK